MPRQKDLKRLVRARMHKTGEAYTSARAHVLAKPRVKPPTSSATAPAVDTIVAEKAAPSPKEYAKLAGMSDAIIKEKTGCSWERWVKSLDYHGAAEMSHRDIATLIHEKYKTPSCGRRRWPSVMNGSKGFARAVSSATARSARRNPARSTFQYQSCLMHGWTRAYANAGWTARV